MFKKTLVYTTLGSIIPQWKITYCIAYHPVSLMHNSIYVKQNQITQELLNPKSRENDERGVWRLGACIFEVQMC